MSLVRPLLVLGAATAAAVLGAPRARRLGATDTEVATRLHGDDEVPDSRVVANHGVTIAAEPEHVWRWLVQIGQDRGGFYSYDALENLIGLDIRSAERLEERWQGLTVGDVVRLAPSVELDVVVADPGRALVLRAPGAMFTWAFALQPTPDGGTRLLARERYSTRDVSSRLGAELVSLVSVVMSRKMLQGIRERAERPVVAPV